MKIESFKYENVLPDGTFADQSGQVEVKGKIIMSQDQGGCDLQNCRCSDGHWVSIIQPRTGNSIIQGLIVRFDNKSEMQEFLDKKELVCK